MPDLLIEIGTEELPSSAVSSGETQLVEHARRLLSEARIDHGPIDSFATPRRLAVRVRDTAEVQRPAYDERRGPPVAQAFLEDDSFAPAAVGFARANGLEPSQLVRRVTPQGEYMFAVRELEGSPTVEVLTELVPALIGSLQFPRSMRWDASKVRFPRPVRWLVALWGSDVLRVGFGQLLSGRTTRGHRLFAPEPVELSAPDDYEQALRKAGVIARRLERRDVIRTQATKAASEIGGTAVIHDRVLDEVTDLVEYPSAVTGRFDEAYLQVPRDVLITAMEAHQRYFAVQDASGVLLPGFVAISNADPAQADRIAAGNERVLRARLDDARFFFEEDLKVSLVERAEQLGGIVFHSGLGTMRDKVLRVGVLLGRTVGWLNLTEDEAEVAYGAADVCKADLTTHLVYEFGELQGVVGREYALRDPDLAGPLQQQIADAVRDHYLPRFPGDDLPSGVAGAALGVADRLDTLLGYAGLGLTPTGSEDPFALRRQASGLVAILVGFSIPLPLDEAIQVAYEQYQRAGVELAPLETCGAEVKTLLISRTEALLEREGVSRMFVQAARGSGWSDLADLAKRARALRALHDDRRLHALAVAQERCFNLSRGGPYGDVEETALHHESEQNLYHQLLAVEEIAREWVAKRDYAGVLETLVPLSAVIDEFLSGDRSVLVMDPDPAVKRNRLALLERTARLFAEVADFSVIPPKLLEQREHEAEQVS